MASFERLELLATVADLYYIDQCSQAEIAERLGYSRSAVSRLLAEAHERQLVEIRINYPLQREARLEHALRDTFGLEAVYVSQRGNLSYDRMLLQVGRLAARHLEDYLGEPFIIGLSWGTAVYEVVSALTPRRYRGIEVVQMIGGLGSVHGAFLGAIFLISMPQVIAQSKDYLPAFIGQAPGLQGLVYGLVLIAFVLFEPMGIYGRWLKVRTYLQIFPFYRKGMFKRQKSFQKSDRLR